jgi:hypothetical protein
MTRSEAQLIEAWYQKTRRNKSQVAKLTLRKEEIMSYLNGSKNSSKIILFHEYLPKGNVFNDTDTQIVRLTLLFMVNTIDQVIDTLEKEVEGVTIGKILEENKVLQMNIKNEVEHAIC